ncbi:unnamed protein product [Effrenium voratum]|nr:unnamed protein product [Effrenium voratum]
MTGFPRFPTCNQGIHHIPAGHPCRLSWRVFQKAGPLKRVLGVPRCSGPRLAIPLQVVAKLEEIRKTKGVTARPVSDEEIVERLFFPLINEGFKILEEGYVARSSDVDIAPGNVLSSYAWIEEVYIYGYGFPPSKGGPMFFAENYVGFKKILEKLKIYGAQAKERFTKNPHYLPIDYFEPSKLLEACVAKEGTKVFPGQTLIDVVLKVRAQAEKDGLQAAKNRDEDDLIKPIFDLPGPLRPPAAPAKYKALTKIRLRVAPSRLADLTTPSYEIPAGQEFHVIESHKDEEDESVLHLLTSQEHGGAWFMERGIVGKFAGKKVARRIAGSLELKKAPAVMQISEVAVEEPEVLPPKTGSEEDEFAGVNEAPPSPYERRKPVLQLLEDPEIQKICQDMGVDMEEMKKKPEFVEAIARSLYGDEVVS